MKGGYIPGFEEFSSLKKRGNLIPVYREILSDFDTPVSAFRKISNSDYAFLLESVEGGEKWARYSFLGCNPSVVIRAKGKDLEIIRNSSIEKIKAKRDLLEELKELLSEFRPVEIEGLPRFCGGAVGYIGYDIAKQFESLPACARDDLGIPDALLLVTDCLIVFDNVTHKTKVIANAYVGENAGCEELKRNYEQACEKIDGLIERLRGRADGDANSHRRGGVGACGPIEACEIDRPGFEGVVSNVSKGDFEKGVSKIIEYIRAGDVIQVVPAQRFALPFEGDTFDVYRALRTINPSPYMFYLKLDELCIAGSSPEVLVRLEGEKIEVRPIAGTRPRGATEAEDERLARELLEDPKELSEHIMLVDLGRNDVGRVSKAGSVKVDDLMCIERYSHVLHIVSNVTGELKAGLDMFDVFRSCFPAGTLTGAPKIRAMEIIDEVESTARGPYGGAVGFFSFSGNMDTCITIRTVVIEDAVAYVQAGAGVVADSDPHAEYEETLNKARGMIKAIKLAQSGLD